MLTFTFLDDDDVELREDSASLVTRLGYIERTIIRPYEYADPPPDRVPWQNYRAQPQSVRITNARKLEFPPTIAAKGFRLCNAPSAVTDFRDRALIRKIYYREAAELARTVTGAKSAHVFDHVVRKREPGPATFGRGASGEKPSADGRIHNDYTESSGPARMRLVLGDDAEDIERYAIVNVWRPIRRPVLNAPLALCDALSISPSDLVATDVYYATHRSEIYLAAHSASHRWFYFPAVEPDEALVFKQYDSLPGATRFVPHAAFEHPEAEPDAPPRETIEIRCLVVF